MTVEEIAAFRCTACNRAFFGRSLAEACAEACAAGARLDELVASTGVEHTHLGVIAVGPWPEGTDPPAVPDVRVAVRWAHMDERYAGPDVFRHGWGSPRDDEADVRPEIAAEYTRVLLRMMEARAKAEERTYEGVRAP